MAKAPRPAEKRTEATLRRRARRAGVMDVYADGLGTDRIAPARAVEALLEVLGVGDDDGVSAAVGHVGDKSVRLGGDDVEGWNGLVELEEGGTLAARGAGGGRVRLAGPLPLGVHRLALKRVGAERAAPLLAAPRRLDPRRTLGEGRLGVFLPLHAVRSEHGAGVGTLADLGELVRWTGETVGGFVGTLPLFPAFLDRPFDPSPYEPVSRLFWNELFVDPRRAPEWRAPGVRRLLGGPGVGGEMIACRGADWVDYRRSWRVTRRLLGAMSAAARRDERRWDEVRRAAGGGARGYATFRAATEQMEAGWHQWRASWRRGRLPASAVDARTVDVYVYAQALANEQMAAVARAAGGRSPLYLDLPVGVHPAGYDAWRWPELFLAGVSAGAPPDGLHAGGQVWGFPPMHPAAGRADGYTHLRAILRRMFGVAGIVRIDHVMWLERVYCVPPGFNGSEGAYLRYPAEELMAVLMIEAARAGGVVVGEDLGTVTDTMRRRMRRKGLLGMHVQQFALGEERGREIGPPPPHCLASLNTHDTPTFAGYWTGADIGLRRRLGHVDAATARGERAGRARTRRAVAAALKRMRLAAGSPRQAATSLLQVQARSDAAMTLVNLEDLWGETRPQNVPGTLDEYPNWRRRTPRTAAQITGDTRLVRILRALREARLAKAPATRRAR